LQRPRPPLVVGGRGERRTLRAAARWADQWNFPGGEPSELGRLVEVLHQRCHEVGRHPAEIEVSVQYRHEGEPGATAELGARYREAGADHLVVYLTPPFDPGVLAPLAEAMQPVLA
jgi:hypothetical protein